MHRNLGVFTGARRRPRPRSSASSSARTAASPRAATARSTSALLEKRIVGMISHLGRHAPGGRRAGPGRAAPGHAPGGGRLHRRRRHERGRLPRGGEPGRGVEAAGALRDREQPVRPLDAGRGAVRVPRPGRPRASATASPGVVVDGNDLLAVHRAVERGGRARAARRGADAARVQDLPHARPRGGLGHRLRAPSSCSRSGRARTRSLRFERLLHRARRPDRRRARGRCARS